MATGRQKYHTPEAEASAEPATAKERMAAKVRTSEGKALYARRKVIVEPVFGQIKEVRGFRRFLLRGLEKLRGEWRLVCLTHNLLKLWRYGCAPLARLARGSGRIMHTKRLLWSHPHWCEASFSLQSVCRQQT
jgi:Transposase DDE domain